MPGGVTPTRARRRQSDAKWRASVAMCYNIMKNVIPDQKKLGRRKVSKALTLKETERHIVGLEKMLKELLEDRAPLCGKVIMMETDEGALIPASFDNIRRDFAIKQHALFTCTATGSKKKYNVPADIEASLDQLSQQTCELITMDRKEAEISFPQLRGKMENHRLKSQLSDHKELESLLNSPDDLVDDTLCKLNKTPAKKTHYRQPKIVAYTTGKRESADNSTHILRKNAQKACKKLPFQNQMSSPSVDSNNETKSRLKRRRTTSSFKSSPSLSKSGNGKKLQFVYSSTEESPCSNPPCKNSLKSSDHSSSRDGKTSVKRGTQATSRVPSGFTPVKLPIEQDNNDPVMMFSGTPAKSTIGSPLGCLSIPETPGSCFNGVSYFELSDEEGVTNLLCTESIDSVDVDNNFNNRWQTEEQVSKSKTKVRRRLDRDYEFAEEDQKVPGTDKSCLEFDGYLLFHQHSSEMMDPDCAQSEKVLNTAHMWEKLEDEERALYASMASQSQDPHDLSADLLSIDLKPLSTETGIGYKSEDSQEVPNVVLNLSQEMQEEFKPHFIEGYEDLGVFYHDDHIKQDLSDVNSDGFGEFEDQSQVVPQM